MRLRTSLPVLAALAVATPAPASVVIPLTVEQLTQRADAIVHGRVTAQRADWTRGGRIITTTSVEVIETLKGEVGEAVAIRTLGGIVSGIGQQVAGETQLAVGDEVLVFLRRSRLSDGSFQVVGMAQGKFTLAGEGAARTATQNLAGLGFADRAGGPVVDRVASPIRFDDLRARIRAAVRQ